MFDITYNANKSFCIVINNKPRVIAGTMNPKAGITYYVQPVAESLHIKDYCGHTRNLYM